MKVIFSISSHLAKSTKLELSRLTDSNGQNPGVQSTITHSTQVAWQFQLFKSGESNVVIVIESYSRYVLLFPFNCFPTWDEVTAIFFKHWLAHMQGWMAMGGFIRNSEQEKQLKKQFQAQAEPQLYRNLDMSINGHIANTQIWIRDYMDQTGVKSLEPYMAK